MNRSQKLVEICEGKPFDVIFKNFGDSMLTVPQGKNILKTIVDLKDQQIINADQYAAISSTIHAAAARSEDIKFGNVLNKIYDNDKAAEIIRKNLAG